MLGRFIAIVALVSSACSSGSSSDPTPGTIPADELRVSFRDAWCSYLVRCGELANVDTCATARLPAPFPVQRDAVAAVLVGRASYDAAAAEACFAQIANATCDRTDEDLRPRGAGSYAVFGALVNPDVCGGIVKGLVPVDGRCSVGPECVSNECSVVVTDQCPGGCCTGTCLGTREPLSSGEPCDPNLDVCVDGFCRLPQPFSSTNCASYVPQGLTCDPGSWSECASGLACVTTTSSPMNTCQPLPTLGQPCPNGLCRDDGTTCGSSGICVVAGLDGASCTGNGDCSSYYACTNGQCAPILALQSCFDGDHSRCFDDDLVCDLGTCRLEMPEGGDCSSMTGRRSDLCASGICEAQTTGPHAGDSRFGVCAGVDVSPACY